MIRSGDLTLFDSGAILLYLADGTPLLPANQRPQLTQWVFAALNTVEMASGFWTRMILAQRIPEAFGPPPGPEVVEHARRGMNGRFDALERLMRSEAHPSEIPSLMPTPVAVFGLEKKTNKTR